MLKLEKAAKSRELNVILRDKPRLLSYTFLLALSYALFCHLLAVIVFQVAPFKIGYHAAIIPPVFVATDSPTYLGVLTPADERPLPEYLILPGHAPQPLPRQIGSLRDKPSFHLLDQWHGNPFLAMEEALEIELAIDLFDEITEQVPLKVHLSGGLSGHAVQWNGAAERQLKEFAKAHPAAGFSSNQIQFAVQVDGRNGKIFWWEALGQQNLAIQSLAVELLKGLRIKTPPIPPIYSGMIEISFTLTST